MIVVASWVLYRYLAPKTWREWAGTGLVQAFIIALYAEMYGFPLTIYLMVRFFGLDSANINASLWSSLLGVGELGMLISMVLGYALLFVGIGLFGEGVVHWPTLFSVALFPVIVLVYWRLARSEEERVLEEFGDEYRAYRRRVPMFIPRFGQWGQFVEHSSAGKQAPP